MTAWLNKKSLSTVMRRLVIKAKAEPKDQIKKVVQFLDHMAHFPGQDEIRKQRKGEHQHQMVF